MTDADQLSLFDSPAVSSERSEHRSQERSVPTERVGTRPAVNSPAEVASNAPRPGFPGGELFAAMGMSRWKVEPSPARDSWLALAARLPSGVRFGTSSWSFPGWEGVVYARRHGQSLLANEGLAGYSQHPLLNTVGVDRSYYRPVEAGVFAELAEQVASDFRFLVKGWDRLLLPIFPRHSRYGVDAGAPNPDFLSVELANKMVVEPALEGLGDKLGVILWQFSPFAASVVGGEAEFAARLERFIGCLAAPGKHAVEIRTRALLGARYAEALAECGAEGCLVIHPSMPDLSVQRDVLGSARATRVIRWMLQRGMTYEGAKSSFSPFDRLAAPDPSSRDAVAQELIRSVGEGREVNVIINNKAEGSAPLSVIELAALAAQRLAEASGS